MSPAPLAKAGRVQPGGTSKVVARCFRMHRLHSDIDVLHAGESRLAILTMMNASAFPWEEQISVGVCQARACREWVDACFADEVREFAQRRHHAVLRAIAR
jgi:hypothetical protein